MTVPRWRHAPADQARVPRLQTQLKGRIGIILRPGRTMLQGIRVAQNWAFGARSPRRPTPLSAAPSRRSANGNRVRRTLTLRDGAGTGTGTGTVTGSLQHLDVHAQIPVCRPGRHHQAIRHGETTPAPDGPRQVPLGRTGHKAQRHQLAGPAKGTCIPEPAPVPRPRVLGHAGPAPAALQRSTRGQRPPRRASQQRGGPPSRSPAARRPGPAEDQDSHRDEAAQAPRPCSRLQIRLQNTWQGTRKITSGPLTCTFVAGAGFEPATSGL
jgi:hypothetical protein